MSAGESPARRCPKCGTELSSHDSVCPRCAFGEALADTGAEQGSGILSLHDIPQSGQKVSYIGDYELIDVIARGGMGVVYRARQRSLNRIVALKMLLGGIHASDEFKRRFILEAKSAAKLNHPNIVSIHDWGEDSGQPFFSMDYIEGITLTELARDKPMPPRAAARIVDTLAQAMQHAHNHGILHRDLKPSNVLVNAGGLPRITDFGLARETNQETMLTGTGNILGTPGFLPPEQVSGQRGQTGPHSDVYGLGAILYYLLTSRPPHVANTVAETLRAVEEYEPIAPRRLNPSVPVDLETICLKCLEKLPERRYESAEAFGNDLGRFIAGDPIVARPSSNIERVIKWALRKPALAGSIALLLLITTLGVSGITWNWFRAEFHATAAKREAANALFESERAKAAKARADRMVETLEMQRAEQFFESDKARLGIAQLVHILRAHPSNTVAAERLMSALTHRSFPLPLPVTFGIPPNLPTLFRLSANSQYIVARSGENVLRVWRIDDGSIAASLTHSNTEINDLDISPDNKTLLTVCTTNSVLIWDWQVGRVVCSLRHPRSLTAAMFSSDGKSVITGCDDEIVRIWDPATGQLVESFAHTNRIVKIAASADARVIAAVCGEKAIHVWQRGETNPRRNTFRVDHVVHDVAVSPDGTQLLVGEFQRAHLWKLTSSLPDHLLLPHMHWVIRTCFSPDGGRVLTASPDGSARLWDANNGYPIGLPMRHSGAVQYADFGADGLRIVTGGGDDAARLWDGFTAVPLGEFASHHDKVWRARLTPDGTRLVIHDGTGFLQVWDVREGRSLAEPRRHGNWVASAVFSPDGHQLVSADHGGSVAIGSSFDIGVADRLRAHRGHVRATAFNPSGETFATGDNDGRLILWTSNGKPYATNILEPISISRSLRCVSNLAFNTNGSLLAVCTQNGNASVIQTTSGRIVVRLPKQASQLQSIQFSPDGSTLLIAGPGPQATLWDARLGNLLAKLVGHDADVECAVFSPDGSIIATGAMDGTARIWNGRSGASLSTILHHTKGARRLTFSPDSKKLCTVGASDTALVWDLSRGQLHCPPLVHKQMQGILGAAFSPDGRRIATSSEDRTCRIWDAITGLPVSEPLWHLRAVTDVVFSSDGRNLASCAHDDAARVWEIEAPPPPLPGIILDLADAVAGARIQDENMLEKVRSTDWTTLRATSRTGQEYYDTWMRWFFADRWERAISPNSFVSVKEFSTRRLHEKIRSGYSDSVTAEVRMEAVLLAPTSDEARLRCAKELVRLQPKNSPFGELQLSLLQRWAAWAVRVYASKK